MPAHTRFAADAFLPIYVQQGRCRFLERSNALPVHGISGARRSQDRWPPRHLQEAGALLVRVPSLW